MRKIDLANKVAVITGATSRIGFALAVRAAQQGMKVAIVDGDEVRLALALKRLREKELRCIALHRGVSDLAEVRNLARCIELELGPPWLICNTCESSAELNIRAVTHGIEVFAPILAERGAGHIVNIIPADFLHSSCPAVSAAELAEAIFDAVTTRRFRISIDGPGTSGVAAPSRQRSNSWHARLNSEIT